MDDSNKNKQQDLQSFQKEIKSDFALFKQEVIDTVKSMESRMFFKLSGVIISTVTVAFLGLTWMFDYRFDFIGEEVSEVRQEVYTPSKDILLREIRENKSRVDPLPCNPVKRKINNLSDSSHGTDLEEK